MCYDEMILRQLTGRSDLIFRDYMDVQERHIKCIDTDNPLSAETKEQITKFYEKQHYPMKIIFD
jgi:hypothetical protein